MLEKSDVLRRVGLDVNPAFFVVVEKNIEHRVPTDTKVSFVCFQYECLELECFVSLEFPERALVMVEMLFYRL